TSANYGLAPLGDGIGLFIATPSFDGKMTFNVTSTREIMPDCLFFVDCLEDAFNELLAAATPRGESKKKTKAKTSSRSAPQKRKAKPGGRAKAPQKKESARKTRA
ncbi:MAG: WS/DGAT domain-containing protein, partial [Pseudomonadota bacterium]